MQQGSGRGLACLHLGVVEVPAFLPLRHVGARLDAIEGAQSGPLDRSGWAGLLALRSRESGTTSCSVVPTELPICLGRGESGPGMGQSGAA